MFVWKNYRKIVIVVSVMLLLFGTAHAKQDNPNAYAWVESLTENRIGVIACNITDWASFVQQNFTAVHDLSGVGKIYQLEYAYKDTANCYHWIGGWTPWKTGDYTLFGCIDDKTSCAQYLGKISVSQLKLFLSIITFWR